MNTRYLKIGPGFVSAVVVLLLVLAVDLAASGEHTTQLKGESGGEKAASPDGISLLSMSAEAAARLSPMLREMRQTLITEKDQLAVLYEEFARATDSRQALEVQKRIRGVKFDTKIALLEVQAANARAQGRNEDAESLEQVIGSLVARQEGGRLVRPETGTVSDEYRHRAEPVQRAQ